jgi:hypothetical protein
MCRIIFRNSALIPRLFNTWLRKPELRGACPWVPMGRRAEARVPLEPDCEAGFLVEGELFAGQAVGAAVDPG